MQYPKRNNRQLNAHANRGIGNRPGMKGVWLFGVTALLATATIAAIRLNPDSEQVNNSLSASTSLATETVPINRENTNKEKLAGELIGPWNEIRVRRGDTFGHILDSRGLYSSVIRNLMDVDSDAK